MSSKRLFVLSVCCLVGIGFFAGCKTTRANSDTNSEAASSGVRNKAKIVHAVGKCAAADFSKNVMVVLDDKVKNSPNADDALRYAENALKFAGFTISGNANAKVIVDFSEKRSGRRTDMDFTLKANEDGKEVWFARSYCNTKPAPIQDFLPGLAAGVIPVIGKNMPFSTTNIDKNPQYLNAVYGY